jgi:hypothetical protein
MDFTKRYSCELANILTNMLFMVSLGTDFMC